MTPKRARFVEEYLVDLNATQAAIRAGYSEKTAHSQGPRLLENVEVAAAVKEAEDKRSERTGVTQDWIIERLTEVAERCMQHEPVLTRQGKPTGEYKFDSHGATRALELLGKHLGLFPDRFKHSLENGDPLGALAKLLGVKPEDLPE